MIQREKKKQFVKLFVARILKWRYRWILSVFFDLFWFLNVLSTRSFIHSFRNRKTNSDVVSNSTGQSAPTREFETKNVRYARIETTRYIYLAKKQQCYSHCDAFIYQRALQTKQHTERELRMRINVSHLIVSPFESWERGSVKEVLLFDKKLTRHLSNIQCHCVAVIVFCSVFVSLYLYELEITLNFQASFLWSESKIDRTKN